MFSVKFWLSMKNKNKIKIEKGKKLRERDVIHNKEVCRRPLKFCKIPFGLKS